MVSPADAAAIAPWIVVKVCPAPTLSIAMSVSPNFQLRGFMKESREKHRLRKVIWPLGMGCCDHCFEAGAAWTEIIARATINGVIAAKAQNGVIAGIIRAVGPNIVVVV
jgi:hypothetical protein